MKARQLAKAAENFVRVQAVLDPAQGVMAAELYPPLAVFVPEYLVPAGKVEAAQ